MNAGASFGLGECYFWLSTWESAIQFFEASIENDYAVPGLAYEGQGWSAYNLHHYEDARTAFEAAIELLSNYPGSSNDIQLADAHLGAGQSWIGLNECDQAVFHFEKALEIDHTLRAAENSLSGCESLE